MVPSSRRFLTVDLPNGEHSELERKIKRHHKLNGLLTYPNAKDKSSEVWRHAFAFFLIPPPTRGLSLRRGDRAFSAATWRSYWNLSRPDKKDFNYFVFQCYCPRPNTHTHNRNVWVCVCVYVYLKQRGCCKGLRVRFFSGFTNGTGCYATPNLGLVSNQSSEN